MSQRQNPTAPLDVEGRDRKSLITIAAATAVLAALHFTDHVIRGHLVAEHHLDSDWDHSGWPFKSQFTPFSISLIAVAVLLGGGILFTMRRRLWAGYWLGAAVVLAAIVIQVHLIPTAHQESPSVIYDSWVDNPVGGILALVDTFAIIVVLIAMAFNAYRVARNSGRWR